MKFLHLFKSSSAAGFARIQGYEDIKDIVRRVLDSDENYNILFVGRPASSKTLFLRGILEMKSGVYFDGSNTTNRILDVLQERRLKIICIDELDKREKNRGRSSSLSNMYTRRRTGTTIYLKYIVAMSYSDVLTNRVRTLIDLVNSLCKNSRCKT